MPKADLGAIEAEVRRHFVACAKQYDLRADDVRADYVLNWGGFVNHSFRITDGRTKLHVKLANEADILQSLRRWQRLRAILEARYHAPKLLGGIVLDRVGLEGAVFQWIAGNSPPQLTPGLSEKILPILHALHSDLELAGRLKPDFQAQPCSQTFLRTFARRAAEDLDFIEKSPPPFVSRDTLAWMRQEAARLAETVRGSASFGEQADSPIHGDLWLNNILVTPEDEWYVLDWDELALGDPALDFATLFGPSSAGLNSIRSDHLSGYVLGNDALQDRLPVYSRASLLDCVIDPLSDYIDADVAPEHMDRVRAEKERIHLSSLSLYRALYSS